MLGTMETRNVLPGLKGTAGTSYSQVRPCRNVHSVLPDAPIFFSAEDGNSGTYVKIPIFKCMQ